MSNCLKMEIFYWNPGGTPSQSFVQRTNHLFSAFGKAINNKRIIGIFLWLTCYVGNLRCPPLGILKSSNLSSNISHNILQHLGKLLNHFIRRIGFDKLFTISFRRDVRLHLPQIASLATLYSFGPLEIVNLHAAPRHFRHFISNLIYKAAILARPPKTYAHEWIFLRWMFASSLCGVMRFPSWISEDIWQLCFRCIVRISVELMHPPAPPCSPHADPEIYI